MLCSAMRFHSISDTYRVLDIGHDGKREIDGGNRLHEGKHAKPEWVPIQLGGGTRNGFEKNFYICSETEISRLI